VVFERQLLCIKVKTEIPYDRTLDIYQYVTNQFSDGTPINWQLKRHIKAQGSGLPDYSHQTHNLDISLPLDNWAVRVTRFNTVLSITSISSRNDGSLL